MYAEVCIHVPSQKNLSLLIPYRPCFITFSSVCWALVPPWVTATPITSLYHLMKCSERFLTRNGAQDAPHSLGDQFANQFSWERFVSAANVDRVYRCFVGTMTTLLSCGSKSSGSLNRRFLRHAHTMRRTVCSVPMGCE